MKNCVAEDDLILDDDGVYCAALYENIFKAIGGNLESILEKNKNSHEVYSNLFYIYLKKKIQKYIEEEKQETCESGV
jgi:hypothetical protein